MSTMFDIPSQALVLESETAVDEEIRSQVWGLLGSLYPSGGVGERRGERRFPYPYRVQLTPVGDDDLTPVGEPLVVVGKHLSERGLGFYHPKPLAYRRVIASLETTNGSRLCFLLDLNWCRFTHHAWYESGGRFLRTVPSPE